MQLFLPFYQLVSGSLHFASGEGDDPFLHVLVDVVFFWFFLGLGKQESGILCGPAQVPSERQFFTQVTNATVRAVP